MPTIDATDLDWLVAYSNIMYAVTAPVDSGDIVNRVDVSVPVTFDVSEEFTDFEISFPFTLPQGSLVAFNHCDPSGIGPLTITDIDATIEPGPAETILKITGSNLAALVKHVTFHFDVITPHAS